MSSGSEAASSSLWSIMAEAGDDFCKAGLFDTETALLCHRSTLSNLARSSAPKNPVIDSIQHREYRLQRDRH